MITYSLYACASLAAVWVFVILGAVYLLARHLFDVVRGRVSPRTPAAPSDAEWVLAEAEEIVAAAEREMGLL